MRSIYSDPLRMASLVAHQLKSPITSSISIMRTLLGEFAGPLSQQQRDLLEKAEARCQESLTAAQRLLTTAKALEQPESLAGESNLVAQAQKARLRYADQAAQRHIELVVRSELETALAGGQEFAILEILEALIHNAIKYTPDHGRIEVSINRGLTKNTFQLTVADSGIGVAPEDRVKIFDPFYRTDSAQQSTRPGTGLGLAFVKTVAEALGGNVSVRQSSLGGAEFIVTFPVAQQAYLSNEGDVKMYQPLKVVIVGGVAAGPKVASKVARLIPDADITIIDKGKILAYAGCGLPYYISGVVKDQAELTSSHAGVVRDPVFSRNVKNVHVMNQTEVLEIDRSKKRVNVRNYREDQKTWINYDKLVLATGATPIIPDIKGNHLKNIFTLHGVTDAEGIKSALENQMARDVVIIGGGLIGIEITDALAQKGCRVTIVEQRTQILRILDWEIAKLVENHLEAHGVKVLTETSVEAFYGYEKVTSVSTNRGILPADLVISAIGVHPNVSLAKKAGLNLGVTGGIAVDGKMQTSDPDIYAAGDCTETTNLITQKPDYIPLGSTANKQGRVAAINLCGGNENFPGVLGTIACKVFDCSIARTGLTESAACGLELDVTTALIPAPDREHFIPGAKTLLMKFVVDTKTRCLLGAQAIGSNHVDKRIDVAAMAVYNKMTIDQIANMDLCYAPPFAPVMDSFITAANITRNKLDGYMQGISPQELYKKIGQKADFILLDVRNLSELDHTPLPNITHIPLGSLRERLGELSPDKEIITFCNYSLRAYEASLILKAAGFKNVHVLDGGLEMWPYKNLT